MKITVETTVLTYEQAQQVHHTIVHDYDHGGAAIYPFLRQAIASRLLEDWPEDEGLGTSDVSIAVTEALRFFEVPYVGPIVKAYEACGFTIPASIAYPDAFTV